MRGQTRARRTQPYRRIARSILSRKFLSLASFASKTATTRCPRSCVHDQHRIYVVRSRATARGEIAYRKHALDRCQLTSRDRHAESVSTGIRHFAFGFSTCGNFEPHAPSPWDICPSILGTFALAIPTGKGTSRAMATSGKLTALGCCPLENHAPGLHMTAQLSSASRVDAPRCGSATTCGWPCSARAGKSHM